MTMIKWQPRNHRHASDFNRYFGNFLGHAQGCGEESCNWAPRVDITESNSDYGIVVEVPGVEKSEISIKVEDGHLIIGGERKTFDEESEFKFRRQERFHGKFERRFSLPEDVEIDDIKAEYNSGLLNVSIPKGEKVKGRAIEVN
jgi:HSP20 family protein